MSVLYEVVWRVFHLKGLAIRNGIETKKGKLQSFEWLVFIIKFNFKIQGNFILIWDVSKWIKLKTENWKLNSFFL